MKRIIVHWDQGNRRFACGFLPKPGKGYIGTVTPEHVTCKRCLIHVGYARVRV